jgi:hypothetical protein
VIDDLFFRISDEDSRTLAAAVSKSIFGSLNTLISSRVKPPTSFRGTLVPPLDALRYFHDCREMIEGQLRREAKGYPSFRWLWYLRRMPRVVFEGHLSSTFTYDSRLAEVLVAQSGDAGPTLAHQTNPITFPVNEHVLRRVLQFCETVRFLSTIHSQIRLTSKGILFKYMGESILKADATPNQAAAIELYDDRVAKSENALARSGSIVAPELLPNELTEFIPMFAYLQEPGKQVPECRPPSRPSGAREPKGPKARFPISSPIERPRSR